MPGLISRQTRSVRTKATAANSPASSIVNFTKLSKQQVLGKDVVTDKTVTRSKRSPPTTTIEIVLSSRKRKTEDDRLDSAAAATATPTKKARRDPEARLIATATPVSSRKRKTVTFAVPENTAANTPSRALPTLSSSSSKKRAYQADETAQTETLLERLAIQSPIRKRTKTIQNDSSSPDLPRELLDLLDMHVAFLEALSMQYAHNGTTSPIDLQTLCLSITRTWGKRQVTVDDIQRCIGVVNYTTSKKKTAPLAPYFLSDYGRSRICIDFLASTTPGPLNEKKLNNEFTANLRKLWETRSSTSSTVTLFLATLPKAPIQQSAAAKAKPISQGQRTLQELKNGIVARKQQEEDAKKAKAEAVAQAIKPDGTKMSLLDRIKLKESRASSQAAQGPTTAELQRQAALHRAEDVAAVIGMLCRATAGGQARVSFTMQVLMTRLKESLRVPVSQEDGLICVRLLAKEVAPQWLRIVTVGGRENVVCMTAMEPSKAAVQERVKALLG
ncbi:hypothetical protein QBC35DRAFT_487688 [Podospora australis]|uniref:DNA replication factor Cdt1 C-terminal domain-containing protein n=1 Tax=Podospora australis TaxID=1536484 RepID=A0AAN7AL59_9PEZI|nr:hypothetical protein QBC35DRAFT_487688 [Podospora australis]